MFNTTIKVNVANAIANTTANKRAGAFMVETAGW